MLRYLLPLIGIFFLSLGLAWADTRTEEALAALDSQYDDSFMWWAEVYDPVSGGCFYSLSGKENRDDPRFGPDIEATSKLVNVLEWSGLLEDTSSAFKAGVIEYMQERQDPDSGFFRDPQHIEQYHANTLDRAAGMASGSIRKCGGEPLYPLPLERTKDNPESAAHYAHLESPAALRAWLETLTWDTRVWTAGAKVRAQSGIFKELPEPKRSELLAEMKAFLYAQQQPDGFFGSPDDHWYSRLSGSYKVVSFMERNGIEIPHVKKITDTVMEILFTEHYNNSIVLYNTANILTILQQNGADLSLEDRLAVVERCTELLETMKSPDGGFNNLIGKPQPVANGRLLGLEVVESNTNATGLVHRTRSLLIEFLIGQKPPHPHPAGQGLLDALNAAQP